MHKPYNAKQDVSSKYCERTYIRGIQITVDLILWLTQTMKLKPVEVHIFRLIVRWEMSNYEFNDYRVNDFACNI